MKRLLLSLSVLLTLSLSNVNAQCTVDGGFAGNGMSTDTMPYGAIATPYSEDVTFRVKTIYSGFIPIDSCQLQSFTGAPTGLVQTLSVPVDTTLSGGDKICFNLGGTPVAEGQDTIVLTYRLWATVFGNPVSVIETAKAIFIVPFSDGEVTAVWPSDSSVAELTDHTVTVSIKNTGINSLSGFDVNYSINGGAPVTEAYVGTITAGNSADHVFSTQWSAPVGEADYQIKAYISDVTDDIDLTNDTIIDTVSTHLLTKDVGVGSLVGVLDTSYIDTVYSLSAYVKNYGSVEVNNIAVTAKANNVTFDTEMISTVLAAGDSVLVAFDTAWTLGSSATGSRDICVSIALTTDSTAANDELCASTVMVEYTDGGTTAVISNDGSILGNAYPNPVENQLTLMLNQPLNVTEISVFDVNGKMINLPVRKEFDRLVLDMSNLNSGMYMLSVISEAGYGSITVQKK